MQPLPNAESRKILFATILLLYAAGAVIALVGKVSVDVSSTFRLFATVGTFLALHIYVHARRMTPLQPLFDTVIGGLLATLPLIFMTYVAIGFAMPIADGRLMALDAALRLDWLAFVEFVDARPRLAYLLAQAYSSFPYQLLLLPAYLSLCGQATRAYAFVFAYIVVNLVASVVSIWYPALGAYEALGVDPSAMQSINAYFGFFFLDQFHSVRDSAHFVLDYGKSAGILTFPSVHAAVAALCAWAAWGSRLLRYPLLALNAGMAVSAISHGSHYFVDVIGGLGVAGLSISIATLLFYRPRGRSVIFAQLFGRAPVPGGVKAATAGSRASM